MNQLESTQKRLHRLEEMTNQKIESLNRKRKSSQLDVRRRGRKHIDFFFKKKESFERIYIYILCIYQLHSSIKRCTASAPKTHRCYFCFCCFCCQVWGEMKRLTKKWRDSVAKCYQIEVACKGLEIEIDSLDDGSSTQKQQDEQDS